MPRLSRLLRRVLAPIPLRRGVALTLTERLSSVTHLVSSLEYLAAEGDRRWGGLNNWDVSRRTVHARSRSLGRALDVVADRRVTRALHVVRVAAAVTLLAPSPHRPRLAANVVLSSTSAALYPRQLYGTDGSDQVSFLVQTVAAVARAGQRRSQLVDACLWFVALQSVLSYAVSGWVKLAGPSWRSGQALPGVMRTLTYGDRATWELCRRYPRVARVLGAGVLTMECLFPAVFVARGRLAPLLVGAAGAFHLVNARVMALGRFVWSFVSMYPAVLYVSGPRDRIGLDRKVVERRDDTLPTLCAALMAASLSVGLLAQARRRQVVLGGRDGERSMTTGAGNTLSFRRTGPMDGAAPVIVLESGLVATAEHWEWIVLGLSRRFPTVTYQRAGNGRSSYAPRKDYRLDVAVGDLVDLVKHVGIDRPVVLVGHSLGGYLALQAAARLPGHVRGVGLVDSSHPGELQRSSRQAQGQQALTSSLALIPTSLRLGLGLLLKRPDWVDRLPAQIRDLTLAQYRDPRMWLAGRREWRAAVEEFRSFDGRLPHIDVPLLVLTAGHTASSDPVQKDLHDELADSTPRAERYVIEDADHNQVLTDAGPAHRVAELVAAFVDGLGQTTEVDADDDRAR
ncbi:MAG: alpha/beta fold hydrolase [Egibacteraceae bacterium]